MRRTGGGEAVAFRPDGSVAWAPSTAQMADMVDDFAGTAIVDRAWRTPPICPRLRRADRRRQRAVAVVPVLLGGTRWVVIAAPVASGTPKDVALRK